MNQFFGWVGIVCGVLFAVNTGVAWREGYPLSVLLQLLIASTATLELACGRLARDGADKEQPVSVD